MRGEWKGRGYLLVVTPSPPSFSSRSPFPVLFSPSRERYKWRKVITPLQCAAKRWSLGLVNFAPAVAYHFCLALPTAFTQPGDRLSAEPCASAAATATATFA